ncbi:unnamed protein product [Pseudo-nitzschia multistriata]|uniref:Uncharacterized protein n=1 Tax=Pseudo-nitzschia multistriata TaxID=183589 RepID=A0A448ZH30_9STRA|nr:unnamed protein product [Pseudo-nitzschia multistriata]
MENSCKSTASATGIVDKLGAWNRAWCGDTTDSSVSPTAAEGDEGRGGVTGAGEHAHPRDNGRPPKSPLEDARLALSRLLQEPPPTGGGGGDGNGGERGVLRAVADRIFSVLDDTPHRAGGASFPPHGTRPPRELLQMEWHVVLLLELWASGTRSGGPREKRARAKPLPPPRPQARSWTPSLVSGVLAASAGRRLAREAKQRKRGAKKPKKNKKKRAGGNGAESLPAALESMPEAEKEALVADHLVRVLSRAPFLLPREVPLSEFLADRCLGPHGERLSGGGILPRIFEAFEIPADLFSAPGQKAGDRSGAGKEPEASGVRAGRKKPTATTAATTTEQPVPHKKRKPTRQERLQILARNKKRQRLASLALSSKKKNRGSHFHGHMDDISKLLDQKRWGANARSSSTGKRTAAGTREGVPANPHKRRAGGTSLPAVPDRRPIEKPMRTRENNIPARTDRNRGDPGVKPSRGGPAPARAKDASRPSFTNENAGAMPPADPTRKCNETSRDNSTSTSTASDANRGAETNHTGSDGGGSNAGSGSHGTILSPVTTPKRPSRPRCASAGVVGETPVPAGARSFEFVVGETPVRGTRSRTFVGETPVRGGRSRTFVGETPVPAARSRTFVGETPVPVARSRTFVGETPVPVARSRTFVGETPTPGSATPPPRASSSPGHLWFSPPPLLPSPAKLKTLPARGAEVPSRQPVKLFGLLKRSSSAHSDGSHAAGGTNAVTRASGGRAPRGNGPSSIDAARAYLRRKAA